MKRIILVLALMSVNTFAGTKVWMAYIYHGYNPTTLQSSTTIPLAGEPTFTGGVCKGVHAVTKGAVYISGTYTIMQVELADPPVREWRDPEGMTEEQKRQWLRNHGYDPEKYELKTSPVVPSTR